MALLTGVVTTDGHAAFAKSFGNVGGFPITFASYFKIGMGGFFTTPAGRSPKDPSPALHDVEADGTAGNIFYQKSLIATDCVFIDPSIMQVRCRLQPSEANDDGTGNPPRFFEIGIFDANNVMLIYTTFAEQSKAANKILSNFVQAYF